MNDPTSGQQLLDVNEVNELISAGQRLLLAGSEEALSELQSGDWIGGTTPYFTGEFGGVKNNRKILVTTLPPEVFDIHVKIYDQDNISQVVADVFPGGFSFIIIPAFSETHQVFAKDSSKWKGVFDQPLVGWISGVDLEDRDAKATVFNGQDKKSFTNEALVMHVQISSDYLVRANILNLFRQGKQESIRFLGSGFEVERCLIDQKEQNFYEFITRRQVDSRLPLVADYLGAMINVSIREIDHQRRAVKLFAPVFENVEYRFAEPLLTTYEDEFNRSVLNLDRPPFFSCNCILNFLYAKLEGKKTSVSSAMTFGEIAYMLLNQTMVYLTIEKK